MDKKIRKDVVEWDVSNWSRAIAFFETDPLANSDLTGKKVLDIGGRNGGMSLYWALKGATVVCSDIDENGFQAGKDLHKKYQITDVTYEKLDATQMTYEEEFDIITFKSVLGGVGFDDHYERQLLMMENIYKALKPGGMCFFVENMKASGLHQWARKKMRAWGSRWRYLDVKEIPELTAHFSDVRWNTYGFFGVFGRSFLSPIFGFADVCLDWIFPKKSRYIVSCILKK